MSSVIRDALEAWKVGRHPILQGQYEEAIAELDRLEAASYAREALHLGPDDTLIVRLDERDVYYDPETQTRPMVDALQEDLRHALGHDRFLILVTSTPLDAIVIKDWIPPARTADDIQAAADAASAVAPYTREEVAQAVAIVWQEGLTDVKVPPAGIVHAIGCVRAALDGVTSHLDLGCGEEDLRFALEAVRLCKDNPALDPRSTYREARAGSLS